MANLLYEWPHELPNDLRLRILGNKKILGKSKILVETQPSAQSSFQKLNFGNSSEKTRKNRYQTFLVLSSFTRFLYFAPNILSRIFLSNQSFGLNSAQSPSSLNFFIICISSKYFSNL